MRRMKQDLKAYKSSQAVFQDIKRVKYIFNVNQINKVSI